MSQFFTSGGQRIRVSASASVLPMNIQDWFPLGWIGWISLLLQNFLHVFCYEWITVGILRSWMLLLLINSTVLPKWKSNFHPTNSAWESLLLCTIMDKPFVVVKPLSHAQLFEAPGTATCQPSLSFTISWSLLKFMSIELVMLSNMDKLYCLYSPWNSLDQNTGVDSCSLLQIFPTQGIKPRAPSLQTVFTSWAHREAHCLMGTNHIVCFINFSLSAGYVVIYHSNFHFYFLNKQFWTLKKKTEIDSQTYAGVNSQLPIALAKPWENHHVKSLSRVWLFETPWTVAYQAPLSMGFSRQENWRGLPFPSPGDVPDPGIEPGSPILEADALTSEPPGKPLVTFSSHEKITMGKE